MWLEDLLERKLLINMGKGGVGRSCLSAAMARLAASHGKRVLVCEVNAKERMSGLFDGKKPNDLNTLDQIWQVEENLWAVNIEPWSAMKEYVVQVLRLRLVYNLVFENRAMKYFLRAVPGLQELVFVGKIWYHVLEDKVNKESKYDLVIVDAPATGHGLAMLRIPRVILDISPPGPMRTAAQKIQDMLTDPEICRVNLVTLPEEMPVNELAELYETVEEELELPLGGVWVNQWPMPPCDDDLRELLAQTMEAGLVDEGGWPLWRMGEAALALEERAERHLSWLQERVHLPTVKVPYLTYDGQKESALIKQMEEELSQRLSAKEGSRAG